jgi:hypothetical protein
MSARIDRYERLAGRVVPVSRVYFGRVKHGGFFVSAVRFPVVFDLFDL